jgi:branched-chain amino acid transport system permease protein
VNRRQVVGAAAIGAVVVAFVVATWAGRPVTGTSLFNLLLFTLPIAGIYSLSATGLVVVYSTTGVFNFAQGAIGMMAAYLYWQVTVEWGWPTWLAVVVIVAVVAPLFGVGLDRVVMRHLQGKALVVQLMVTVGLLFGFIGLVNTIWDQRIGRSVPFLFGGTGFHIGSITMTWHRVITVAVSLVLVVGLRILLQRTRFGVAMRAVVDNPSLAALDGARPGMVSMSSWALGSGLAAIAGILLAPETDMSPGGSLTLLVVAAFAAAAVGRIRSLPLTYLGALILAGTTQFSQNFLELGGRWRDIPSAYPAILLLFVLLLLPESQLAAARTASTRRVPRVATPRDTALGMVVVIAAMWAIGQSLGIANVNRFGLAMCTALVVLSLVPLTGWAGQVSLAPLAFAGVGAIAYSQLGGADHHLWAIPLAGLVAVPIGALLALPALRLHGLYLALVTFAFATVCTSVLFAQPFAFAGQTMPTPRISVAGISTESGPAFLVLVSVVFAIAAVALSAAYHSRWGRRLVALRDSEVASATVGVSIAETKLVVFMVSAFIAGLAGAFTGMFYEQTDASPFQALLGLTFVLALVIGGVSYLSGALYAGLFLVGLALLKEVWDVPLLRSIEYLGPGLAALGIIAEPDGAIVPIAQAFARLLPWRHDAREADALRRAATAEPEVGELGLSVPFTESDVVYLDRMLGVADLLPQGAAR